MLIRAGAKGVCGTEFLAEYVPRYSARILELRRDGWVIRRRRCDRHSHQGVQYVYEVMDR
jgi:hypothetical protein